MADAGWKPEGFLGGMLYEKQERQADEAFALDIQGAEQNLYAKSLEIQDYLDAEDYRKKTRAAGVVKAESEIEMTPLRDEQEKFTMRVQKEKSNLEMNAFKMEEQARDLFHLTGENYKDQYNNIPDTTKTALGLTGNWQDDAFKIQQARASAVNTAAHMRAMQLASSSAKGGTAGKATAIKLAKANEEAIHNMLGNDKVYNGLGGNDAAAYRSHLTYLTMDLYQRQIDQVKSGNMDASDIVPFTVLGAQVKQIADKHVSGGQSFLGGMFNTGEFDKDGFNAEVSATYGIGLPKKAIEALQEGSDVVEPGVDMYEGPQPKVPEAVSKAMSQPIASSAIAQYRREKNIPSHVPDFAIFNGLVEAGYLMPDGTLGSPKKKEKKDKRPLAKQQAESLKEAFRWKSAPEDFEPEDWN